MPIYEFYCSDCDRKFDVEQTVDDHLKEVPSCPNCGSEEHVERLISHFHVQAPKKSA